MESAVEEGERASCLVREKVRMGEVARLDKGERVAKGVAWGMGGDKVGWVDEEGQVGGFARREEAGLRWWLVRSRGRRGERTLSNPRRGRTIVLSVSGDGGSRPAGIRLTARIPCPHNSLFSP